jgi:hypothetical protein
MASPYTLRIDYIPSSLIGKKDAIIDHASSGISDCVRLFFAGCGVGNWCFIWCHMLKLFDFTDQFRKPQHAAVDHLYMAS